MRKALAITVVFVLMSLGGLCQAVVIGTVPVGDPGNLADTESMADGTTGYGSVGYVYSIGKYEITAGQYTEFLNKVATTDSYGLWNFSMGSQPYACKIQRNGSSGSYTYSVAADWANRPVNYVSYWDACRFANWMHNGQPSGRQNSLTTEDGAYTLNGYNGTDGLAIQRNVGARWYIPSENEWYKAAYYTGGGTDAGYWDYPTQSDTSPSNQVLPTDPGNSANYYTTTYSIDGPYWRTEAGEFENSGSAYGTFDQAGNVWEWNEGVLRVSGAYTSRCFRGGSFISDASYLHASARPTVFIFPTYEHYVMGFRIAGAVPEPSSFLALGSGLLVLAGTVRRKR